MSQVTWWLWQFDEGNDAVKRLTSYEGLAQYVKQLAPAGHTSALMVKTHSGESWQGTFDSHPLAIKNTEDLIALRLAFDDAGLNLGAWGEGRGRAYMTGNLAGHCGHVAGYYAVDLEPYSEFGLPLAARDGTEATCQHALGFWQGYRDAGGPAGPGVSLVAQPSGIDPFGRPGLLCWLHGVNWLHLQSYYREAPQLHPTIALGVLGPRLAAIGAEPSIIHIVEPASITERLAATRPPDYLDVWRL